MLTSRFSRRTVALIVAAAALVVLLAMNAAFGLRRAATMMLDPAPGSQSTGQVIHPETYYPLPPGKQGAPVH